MSEEERRQRESQCLVEFEPIGRRQTCAIGETVLDVARRAGIAITSLCGGAGVCGRCQVRVLEGEVSPATAREREVLGDDAVGRGERLACETRVLGDLWVHVAAESLSGAQRLELDGRETAVAPVPPVRAYSVRVPAPSLEDPRADATRLAMALVEQHGVGEATIDIAALRELPTSLRDQGWCGSAYVRRIGDSAEVVRFASQEGAPLGLAVDMGTTKIAAHLVDLSSARVLAIDGRMNPQIALGEDVMSRIAQAMSAPERARELQEMARDSVNGLASDLCQRVGRRAEDIAEVVVVGNTAMHHLFLGLPVAQLGTAPYVPVQCDALDVKARDLGLWFAPGAYVHVLPNIAGFVGADHVAMLLATRIDERPGVVLGLDIGTNTELVLKTRDRLITCSTASGPAFEGAHIRDGMRATSGAIERVRVKGSEVFWQTVDGAAPLGLCGSGVLDVVAELLATGVLNSRGRMGSHARVRDGQGGPEFVVVSAADTGHGRDIAITRRDIGAIQLAKGAIRAGIDLLMAEAGVTADDVDQVVLAGAFGTYLSVASVIAIGLLPRVPIDKVEQVGNAAAVGARLALVSLAERERAQRIAKMADYLELTAVPTFAEAFARAMTLG